MLLSILDFWQVPFKTSEIFCNFCHYFFCLIYRLNAEKQLEIVKRKEKTESHLYMVVRILYEDSFYGHQGIFLSIYGRGLTSGGFLNPWDEEISIPETRPIRKIFLYLSLFLTLF